MENKTNLELVTPSKILINRQVNMIVMPGTEGEIGAMVKHTPILTSLKRGLVKIYDGNELSDNIAVDGGIAEINEKEVIILSERAEILSELIEKDIKEKLDMLERQINNFDKLIADIAKQEINFYNYLLSFIK